MAIFVWEEHLILRIMTELQFSCVLLVISVNTLMHQTRDNHVQLTTTTQFRVSSHAYHAQLDSLVKEQL
jgi:hypothetical protein